VHSVHDPVTGSEDDRVRRIHLADEAEVLYDLPDRGPLPLVEPVLGVDLREVIKRDLLYRQMSNPSYQEINVPRIDPATAGPEVILLPHRLSLVRKSGSYAVQDALIGRTVFLQLKAAMSSWPGMGMSSRAPETVVRAG